MLELIYKLNLPPLTEIIKEDSNILESKYAFCIHDKSSEIIKPEWIHWNDMCFDRAISFYRDDGDSSRIHTDHHKRNVTPWAINWVHNGFGNIKYWLPEQIEKIEYKTHSTSTNREAEFPTMTSTQPPYKTYVQTTGVYLVNTAMPHSAKGWNSRLVVSLRDWNNFSLPWEEVVKRFEKYIKA
jgi:hypothetical protein